MNTVIVRSLPSHPVVAPRRPTSRWLAAALAYLFVVAIPAADGDLDPTFGVGGIAQAGYGQAESSAGATIVGLSGGRTLVGGSLAITSAWSIGVVVQLDSEGKLDSSFGRGGVLVLDLGNSSVIGISPVSGDRILVGVAKRTGGAVVRLHADGSLDTSYGIGGVASRDVGLDCDIVSMVVDDSERAVLGGTVADEATGDGNILVMRFTSGGSLDEGFGGAGWRIDDLGSNESVRSVCLAPSGRLIVAGRRYPSSGRQGYLIEYTSEGSRGTTFGPEGFKLLNSLSGGGEWLNSLAMRDRGGMLIIGGTDGGEGLLVGLTAEGEVDTDFGAAGIVRVAEPSALYWFEHGAVADDGRILTSGSIRSSGSQTQTGVWSFDSSGAPDGSFGSGGVREVKLSDSSQADLVARLAIAPGGRILLTSQALTGSQKRMVAARLSAKGSLDAAFGTGGKTLIEAGSAVQSARSFLVTSSGACLVGGSSDSDERATVAKIESDGSIATGFGDDGVASVPTVLSAIGMGVQSSGAIVITGHTGGSLDTVIGLARLTAGGDRDRSFGTDGVITTALPGLPHPYPSGLAMLGNDDFVVSANGVLAGFKANGSLDTGFGTDGVLAVDVGERSVSLRGVRYHDGMLYAYGSISRTTSVSAVVDMLVFRSDSRGRLDPGFGSAGVVVVPLLDGFTGTATSLAISADRIYVGGQDRNQAVLAAVNRSDGSLSTGFGSLKTIGGLSSSVTGIAVSSDGTVLALGGGGVTVAAYSDSGVAVSGFGDGGILEPVFPTGSTSAVGIALDGKRMLIGGSFQYDLAIFGLVYSGKPEEPRESMRQITLDLRGRAAQVVPVSGGDAQGTPAIFTGLDRTSSLRFRFVADTMTRDG